MNCRVIRNVLYSRSMLARREFFAATLALGATLGWRRRSLAQPRPGFIVDAHCHVFNVLDLPVAGFIEAYALGSLHLPVPGFLRSLVQDFEKTLIAATKASAADHAGAVAKAHAVFEDLSKAIPADVTWAKALTNAIDVATKSQVQIATQVSGMYPDVDLFLPCLVDFDGWTPVGSAPPPNDLATRVKDHESVALAFMAGTKGKARFHPFVSFNPRTTGALAVVQKAINEQGFVGVKLYPPCGFSASGNASLASLADGKDIDERLEELFTFCEKNAVPVLAHTSASNEFHRGGEFRASPLTWEDTLERHPKLRLNLGHFGQDRGLVDGCPNVECLVWSMEIASLMQRYDYVYTDIADSALGYDPAYEARYLPLLNQIFAKYPKAPKRILYGSDWWMNELEPDPANYFRTVKQSVEKNQSSVAGDIMGAAALRYLGFREDDGKVNDCNPNWRRLMAYYKAHNAAVPAWLAGPKDTTPSFCVTNGA
jgi:predicted TIM-barrel fold metal-dependent hydrolase